MDGKLNDLDGFIGGITTGFDGFDFEGFDFGGCHVGGFDFDGFDFGGCHVGGFDFDGFGIGNDGPLLNGDEDDVFEYK